MNGSLFDLTGRTAIVTGGNRGLGLAMASALLDHGAQVMIIGRDASALAQARRDLSSSSGDVEATEADLTEDAGIERCVAATLARFGAMDILINNAGINIRHRPENFPSEDWEQVLEVNLTSVFRLSKAAFPHLRKGACGKIINIGSMTSILGAPLSPAYGASKGAIVSLTKSLATAWAGDGIQVNAILPGWIETDLTEKQMEQMPELRARIIDRTPAGRWGRPSDLGGAAVFLASRASDFVTGTTLAVDGGFSSFN